MSNFSNGEGFFNIKTNVLLSVGGLFFLLVNVIVIFGIDIRPSAWLFYLDMRYWSVSFSVFLWITALWLIAESIGIAEDYRPMIRMLAGTGILFVIISALRSSFGVAHSLSAGYSLWLDVLLVIVVCSVFRSLFFLYDYLYSDGHVDEEAQWCWGVSGFIFVGLAAWGLMSIIPVKTQVPAGANVVTITESLFTACTNGLRELIQTGNISFVLLMFAVLLFVTSVAFVYVTGRWLLIIYLKMRWQ
jgi:hypothetical protein